MEMEPLSPLAERIAKRLDAIGRSMRSVSLEVGSDALIRNIMTGKSKSPRAENLEALARVLSTTTQWLLRGDGPESVETDEVTAEKPTIPIVGKAGAGPDGSVLFAEGDGNFGEYPAPTNSTPTTVALEVQGDSMTGIARDGWIVTYDDKKPPEAEHMGEPCICWLEDGRVLVKTPYPGRGVGLFDLESENARTMRDVPVRYFALVSNIVPRRSAHRYARRNPDAAVEDLSIDRRSA